MKEKVLILLSENKIKEAIQLLESITKNSASMKTVQIKRQFKELNDDILAGVLTYDEKNRRLNQITQSIIKLSEIASQEETKVPVDKKNKYISKTRILVFLGLFLPILIVGGRYFFQSPKMEEAVNSNKLTEAIEVKGQVHCLNHNRTGVLDIFVDSFPPFVTNEIGEFNIKLTPKQKKIYLVIVKRKEQILFKNYLHISTANPLIIPIKSKFCE